MLIILCCLQIYKLKETAITRDLHHLVGEYMPVYFLTSEQKASYGQFTGEPNEIQLAMVVPVEPLTLYAQLDQQREAKPSFRSGHRLAHPT